MTDTHTGLRSETFAEYTADSAMNASTLIQGFKSMLSLKRAIDGEKPEETAAMRFGQDYHRLILEPDEFAANCVVMPDFRNHPDNKTGGKNPKPSTRKTAWSDEQESQFADDNRGKIIVDQKYFDRMVKMLSSLNTHPIIKRVIRDGRTEQTVRGQLAHTPCKGRLDLITEEGIFDLKGTTDCRPHIFGPLACRLHYPEKMAFYRELVRQETGIKLPVFLIVAETDGDFDRCLTELPEPVLDHAFGRISRVMLQYENAKTVDMWPGVDGGQELVDFYVPNWWLPSDEEMEWS